jgi:glycosyltransferase involved in cell wall biosynthesis
MKILLLGDFSLAHYNLKIGLENIGHDVTLVSHGDGFKKTPSDIKLYTRKNNENKYLGAIKEIKNQYDLIKTLKNFDIVQTASHVFFHNRIDKYLFPKLFEQNKKIVLFHAACSEPYNKFAKTLDYSPCVTCKKYDLSNNKCEHEKSGATQFQYARYSKYNAIVSAHYEYYKAFENTIFKQKNHFIQIPLQTSELGEQILTPPEKINVYYGEIRKGFKGGHVIEEAIENVKQSKYGCHFNFNTSSRLPYNEYLKVMNETHVLIDQVNSYSYGVNALVGLSKGKIVLSGAEPEAIEFIGSNTNDCPIINIRPTANDIYNKLIFILENKSQLPLWSSLGIDFVKKYHSPLKIAKEYENLYFSL